MKKLKKSKRPVLVLKEKKLVPYKPIFFKS